MRTFAAVDKVAHAQHLYSMDPWLSDAGAATSHVYICKKDYVHSSGHRTDFAGQHDGIQMSETCSVQQLYVVGTSLEFYLLHYFSCNTR